MSWTTVPNGGTVSAGWTGDLRFDFNGDTVAYNNATAVITLEGIVADVVDDIFTDGNSVPHPVYGYPMSWHNFLPTHLSNGGSVITIEGINQPSNYASAIQLTNVTVPSVIGNYTISVVVDADGPGTDYTPSEQVIIILTVE